jgi:hypothetical protein
MGLVFKTNSLQTQNYCYRNSCVGFTFHDIIYFCPFLANRIISGAIKATASLKLDFYLFFHFYSISNTNFLIITHKIEIKFIHFIQICYFGDFPKLFVGGFESVLISEFNAFMLHINK